MKKHYKSIAEALPIERPGDKVVKILSNKFAIVRPVFENGKFAEEYIMGIGSGNTIYSHGLVQNMKPWCFRVSQMRNVDFTAICYDFPENGRMGLWLMKTNDNRKYKQIYRKIFKLI